MRSQDSVDEISQKHGIGSVLFGLFKELLRYISIELCEIDVLLDYFVEGVIELVFVEPASFLDADSRKLISYLSVVGHPILKLY